MLLKIQEFGLGTHLKKKEAAAAEEEASRFVLLKDKGRYSENAKELKQCRIASLSRLVSWSCLESSVGLGIRMGP